MSPVRPPGRKTNILTSLALLALTAGCSASHEEVHVSAPESDLVHEYDEHDRLARVTGWLTMSSGPIDIELRYACD